MVAACMKLQVCKNFLPHTIQIFICTAFNYDWSLVSSITVILHCSVYKQVVDTRPKGRYDGTAPEPNPKIRSGHMHGSISFPFTNIIDPQTKTMKDADAIKQGVWVPVDDIMVKLIMGSAM